MSDGTTLSIIRLQCWFRTCKEERRLLDKFSTEYQVLCFDEYLIDALAPDLAETYREWIGGEYLDSAHEILGAEGEQRMKDCLKGILEGAA